MIVDLKNPLPGNLVFAFALFRGLAGFSSPDRQVMRLLAIPRVRSTPQDAYGVPLGTMVPTGIVLEPWDPNAAVSADPSFMTFDVDTASCDAAMQALWSEGYRPRDWGSKGEMDALRAHNEDLRKELDKAHERERSLRLAMLTSPSIREDGVDG